jgi:UDP-N-acetyl-D-galactosamine dehydrogenase
MGVARIAEKLLPGAVFADVKSAYDPDAIRAAGLRLWRL